MVEKFSSAASCCQWEAEQNFQAALQQVRAWLGTEKVVLEAEYNISGNEQALEIHRHSLQERM